MSPYRPIVNRRSLNFQPVFLGFNIPFCYIQIGIYINSSGISAFVLVIYLIRARRTQKRVEDKRVAELVQIALDALRNQELAHHTDPITTPYPYLSSLQLRDLILQEVHSVTKRQRIWSAVERIVESNSNVRTNLEETPGGDELRVWRWVGSARKPIFRRGRVPTDKEAREQSD